MNLVTIDTSPGNTAMYIGSNNATEISIGNANANVSFSGKITINNVSSNNASFINISSISGSFSNIYSSGTTTLGRTTIYEATGTDSMTATSGSLVIKHGNIAGASSIVFPSSNSGDDFGYILYKDDKNNTTNERGRLEIGVENNFGAPSGTVNDSLILNKNGGFVGIGTNDPFRTLDVSGNGRFTQGLTCGPLTLNNNITLQPTSNYVEPSSNTMLGGITAGSFPDISFNSTRSIATLTIIEKGTYIIYFNFEARYSTLPTINYINFVGGTALPVPSVIIGPSAVMGTGQIAFFGSVVIAITTVGTLLLKYNISGTITSMLNRNYYAVRIA